MGVNEIRSVAIVLFLDHNCGHRLETSMKILLTNDTKKYVKSVHRPHQLEPLIHKNHINKLVEYFKYVLHFNIY